MSDQSLYNDIRSSLPSQEVDGFRASQRGHPQAGYLYFIIQNQHPFNYVFAFPPPSSISIHAKKYILHNFPLCCPQKDSAEGLVCSRDDADFVTVMMMSPLRLSFSAQMKFMSAGWGNSFFP